MSDSLYDYSRWPNFTKEELVCSFSGKENPNVTAFTCLMDFVQQMRQDLGIPFSVNSAYRSFEHPIEAAKNDMGKPYGMHTLAAIDIKVPVDYCYRVVELAFKYGFKGIGINLKGDPAYRFIHLDRRKVKEGRIWSYP